MTPTKIQLSPSESAQAEKFFAECDASVSGYRLGMENAKQMFLQHLISRREKPPQDEPR